MKIPRSVYRFFKFTTKIKLHNQALRAGAVFAALATVAAIPLLVPGKAVRPRIAKTPEMDVRQEVPTALARCTTSPPSMT